MEPQKNEYKNPNIVKYEKDILYWDQYLQYKRKECISHQMKYLKKVEKYGCFGS